ncbi:unnamed protein product [Phaedon cochleariae]|uniref:Uncharacterized protein n=1 Tax=Phaedon cochleariae TaxID=80249 RepID=A0A9N9X1Q2_PHACE|nr:unnamed protein product [Phaedon cochleariae]
MDGVAVSEETTALKMVMDQLANLTQSSNDLRGLIVSQSDKLDNCLKSIETLEQDNLEIHGKIASLENKLQVSLEPYGNIYQDINMHMNRARNIIVCGLEETEENDQETIKIMVQNITHPEIVSVKNVSWLGKPQTNRIRPLKVALASPDEAVSVLKNKLKISKNTFPNVKIKNDVTPLQQQELKQLYSELNDRRSKG